MNNTGYGIRVCWKSLRCVRHKAARWRCMLTSIRSEHSA